MKNSFRKGFSALLFISVLCLTKGTAQTLMQIGATSDDFANWTEVTGGGQVTGYVGLMQGDLLRGVVYNFTLTWYDPSLNVVRTTNFSRPESFKAVATVSNGSHIVIQGSNKASKQVEMIVYDSMFNQRGVISRRFNEPLDRNCVVPIPGRGFLFYDLKAKGETGHAIELVDNNLQTLWTTAGAKGLEESVTYLRHNKSLLFSLVKGKASRKQTTDDLLVTNISDGTQKLRIPMTASGIDPRTVDFNEATQEIFVFGEYFRPEKRDEFLGLVVCIYDSTGARTRSKTIPWADVDKSLPSKPLYAQTNDYPLFHHAVRTSDGRIFVVGEQYTKGTSSDGVAATAAGVVLGAATGVYMGGTLVQLNLFNTLIIELSPTYELVAIHSFPKTPRPVALPSGSFNEQPLELAHLMRDYFDWVFTEVDPEGESFTVVHRDRDAARGRTARVDHAAFIRYENGGFTTGRKPVFGSSDFLSLHRSTSGKVVVSQYFYAERKLLRSVVDFKK